MAREITNEEDIADFCRRLSFKLHFDLRSKATSLNQLGLILFLIIC